jgi:DNA-binding response OmpR family regulator
MRVLIIEDDLTIAQSIKRGLEQESFAVDVCHDGEEGYHDAASDVYDVIVLDVLLPSTNGIEIARKLRNDNIHSRILMLSAKDQTADRIDGLNTGADDYMVKPFSFEELLARIQALLRRPEEPKAIILQAHNLTLNTITHEVIRNNQAVSLSSKEFAILEYLMRNKGMTLSKENIVAHVWDFDADVLTHTVEAFIGLLRNKIDKPFEGEALIETIRGFGYRINNQ